MRKGASRSAWIDISKPSLRVCSGFVNPLRTVIFSLFETPGVGPIKYINKEK